jgi:hypothetical protein
MSAWEANAEGEQNFSQGTFHEGGQLLTFVEFP